MISLRIIKIEKQVFGWARRLHRHITEWRLVLMEEEVNGTPGVWWRMAKALATGGVSKRVWRRRMRVCIKCPIFDRELRRCRAPAFGDQPPHGCGCYVVFMARTRQPYAFGCWGRTYLGPDVGWGIDLGCLKNKPTA